VKFEPDTAEIIEFSRMCVQEQAHVTTQRVAQWVQHGYTMDDIFLKLIAPVARHLGWMWEEDELDFSQVSLGLIRLQQITHQLGYSYQSGPQIAGGVRRMMIGSVPGSQHLLGLTIVAEFFRKDGWEVVVEMADNKEDLIQAVGGEWFDLIGLSVGLVEQMPLVAKLLTDLKSASKNPNVPLILGGPAFLVAEDKNLELGADGVSLDAAEAVRLGNQLVELPSVGA
jgi:methanogenic corrinoid protein MtbC1